MLLIQVKVENDNYDLLLGIWASNILYRCNFGTIYEKIVNSPQLFSHIRLQKLAFRSHTLYHFERKNQRRILRTYFIGDRNNNTITGQHSFIFVGF